MRASFEAEKVYHVYTHANGPENLFRERVNYQYFLSKYIEHLHPVAETFAYCLMPNHLHLMVRVRKEEEILVHHQHLTGFENLSGVISKQFSNLFNAYTKAINKRYDRRGSLFERPFKRKLISQEAYFTRLIIYIHNNPIHHGFVRELKDWPHSSWHAYLCEKTTKLARKEGLDWFGDREEFKRMHQLLEIRDFLQDFE